MQVLLSTHLIKKLVASINRGIEVSSAHATGIQQME